MEVEKKMKLSVRASTSPVKVGRQSERGREEGREREGGRREGWMDGWREVRSEQRLCVFGRRPLMCVHARVRSFVCVRFRVCVWVRTCVHGVVFFIGTSEVSLAASGLPCFCKVLLYFACEIAGEIQGAELGR